METTSGQDLGYIRNIAQGSRRGPKHIQVITDSFWPSGKGRLSIPHNPVPTIKPLSRPGAELYNQCVTDTVHKGPQEPIRKPPPAANTLPVNAHAATQMLSISAFSDVQLFVTQCSKKMLRQMAGRPHLGKEHFSPRMGRVSCPGEAAPDPWIMWSTRTPGEKQFKEGSCSKPDIDLLCLIHKKSVWGFFSKFFFFF